MAASAPTTSSPRPVVCVFGASWALEGDDLYQLSVSLGKALAEKGFDVVSGGYGGTMEGVSKGSREGGGAAVGVTVPTLFPARRADGNPYLTSQIKETSLLKRIDTMMELSPAGKIALPGTLGTLAEIMAAWNVAALAPVGGYKACKLILWRNPWEVVVKAACENLKLSKEVVDCVVFVDTVEEAVAALL